MTLFVILSLLLGAVALAILAWRGPAVAHVTDPAAAATAVMRPTRGLVVGLGVLIAVVTIGGYAWIGSPRLLPLTPDAPPGPGPAMDAQADTLQARAEAHPEDPEGWLRAARMHAMLNHGAAAVADYRKVAALRPADPNVLADLADMLAATGNGSLDGEPIQLVDRALAIDPNHVKALALKGSYAMTQRDFRTALDAWNHALKVAQPGDPIAQFLRQQMDGMREMAQRAAAAASATGR
ncbi:MAG: tetratricopeptide repeat protein [Burkholderiaceae bacterium]